MEKSIKINAETHHCLSIAKVDRRDKSFDETIAALLALRKMVPDIVNALQHYDATGNLQNDVLNQLLDLEG